MQPQDDLIDQVNPQMVILAREARGLSQERLARELGISQGRLSKIEAGLLPVPAEILEGISARLDFPKSFFAQRGSMYGVGVAEIFHRKRADAPKRLLSKIYAQIEVRIRQLGALLRGVDLPVAVRRFDIDEYGGNAQEVAQLARATWGVARGPISDLTRLAEDVGIVIVPMDFETNKIDAISRWIPSLPPMVFVNERSPKDRYRFSLAHEIGHLLMHEYPSPEMEQQANEFAAEFLCPEHDIRADLVGLTLDRLPQLKLYWGVSMSALIHRAQDIGAITANQARYLWTKMAKAGYTKQEPIELDLRGEAPQLLYEMVAVYQESLGFSLDDIRSLLHVNNADLVRSYLPATGRPRLALVGPS